MITGNTTTLPPDIIPIVFKKEELQKRIPAYLWYKYFYEPIKYTFTKVELPNINKKFK